MNKRVLIGSTCKSFRCDQMKWNDEISKCWEWTRHGLTKRVSKAFEGNHKDQRPYHLFCVLYEFGKVSIHVKYVIITPNGLDLLKYILNNLTHFNQLRLQQDLSDHTFFTSSYYKSQLYYFNLLRRAKKRSTRLSLWIYQLTWVQTN